MRLHFLCSMHSRNYLLVTMMGGHVQHWHGRKIPVVMKQNECCHVVGIFGTMPIVLQVELRLI